MASGTNRRPPTDRTGSGDRRPGDQELGPPGGGASSPAVARSAPLTGAGRDETHAAVLAITDPDGRRLALLKALAAREGVLEPQWDPVADIGYSYLGETSAMDSRMIRLDLDYLTSGGYVQQFFRDRLTRCPHCSSHRLNIREICPECRSANISSEELLSHFRCGFVGSRSAFGGQDGLSAMICPKCMRVLEHLGTDHDIPGINGICYACRASFQEPPVEAACLACGQPTSSEDLRFETVWRFHASGLGIAAARDGYLFDRADDFLFEPGLSVLKAAVFMAMALQEVKRHQRYDRPLSFLVATVDGIGPDGLDRQQEDRMVEVLKADLRDVDFIGRLDRCVFVIALPETDLSTSIAAARRLREDVRSQTGVTLSVEGINADTLMEMVRELHADSWMGSLRIPGMPID